jgi:hypothetical protein
LRTADSASSTEQRIAGARLSFPEQARCYRNDNPKPFVWTATVEQIVKKLARARAKAEQIKPSSTLPRGKKKGA